MFNRIRQYFCRHDFKKHYDTKMKCYIRRCTKCGKVLR